MQTNYFYLQHLSKKLSNILAGLLLTECFSQDKDELIFGFSPIISSEIPQVFYIKASLLPTFACLSFPDDFRRANQNSVDIFDNLIGAKVSFVKQHTNERAFTIHFNNNYLLTFKLFGNKSNIILFKNERVTDVFHHNYISDKALIYSNLDRMINQSFAGFSENSFNISRTFPTLGKELNEYFKSYFLEHAVFDEKEQWQFIIAVIESFKEPQFYVKYYQGIPVLSMLKGDKIIGNYDDPIKAANEFYIHYTRFDVFDREKALEIISIDKHISKLKYGVNMLQKKYNELKNGVKNEEIANILMANMHLIVSGIADIELFDFYRNSPLTIKLKSDLSPQKNAENYYRKAKNEKTELLFLQNSIDEKVNKIISLNEKLEVIKEIFDLKTLRKLVKDQNKNTTAAKLIDDFPFKVEKIDGWDIWIGRNANNNDLLTQKYAKKDDLWFHARDVSGSHVIIRYQSGKNFPKHVIERAAQLAAYNSKRKNDSLCPVIMTPKKFVRKSKNMAAGKVIVDKEEVLLVEPKK